MPTMNCQNTPIFSIATSSSVRTAALGAEEEEAAAEAATAAMAVWLEGLRVEVERASSTV